MDNNIEGNIPNEFAKLPGLQILQVGVNKLAGWFPQALLNLSTLVELSFAYNDLSGDVPSIISNSLPNLQLFELGIYSFHGHIPCSLTNASNLYVIDISENNFTGVVPSSIGKLTKPSRLNLEWNNLHGPNKQDWEFMNSLANCTELQMFSITGNRLEGHVPNSFGYLFHSTPVCTHGTKSTIRGFSFRHSKPSRPD